VSELDHKATVPAFGNLEDAAVENNRRTFCIPTVPLTKKTPPGLRWYLFASKRFANAHPECMAIPALGDVGTQIDVVFLA